MTLNIRLFQKMKSMQAEDEEIDFGLGNLKITTAAYEKMRAYQRLYEELSSSNIEFYAYLIGKRDSDIVTDIYLGPDQSNTSAHTAISEDGVGKAARAIEALGLVTKGWTHYHPGATWRWSSGEDKDNHKKIITAMPYNSRVVRVQKSRSLEEAIDKTLRCEQLGLTLDLSKLDEPAANNLKKAIMLKEDIYRSIVYGYSLILVGKDKDYIELVTFNPRTQEIIFKETGKELIETPGLQAKYDDRQLMMDILTRIKFDQPLIKVIKNIDDLETKMGIWEELKKLDKKKPLPTRLRPYISIFKPIEEEKPVLPAPQDANATKEKAAKEVSKEMPAGEITIGEPEYETWRHIVADHIKKFLDWLESPEKEDK